MVASDQTIKDDDMSIIKNELSVALLFQNIEDVKLFSQYFRQHGIIPFFYEDLKSFWSGIEDTRPDLAFVDVRNMSEGELVLKEHPMISHHLVPLMFYTTEKASPLLISTFDLPHFGVVQKGMFLKEQFESTLKRFLDFYNLKKTADQHVDEIRAKDQQIEELLKARQMHDQKIGYRQYMSVLTRETESLKNKVDFFKSIEAYFERIPEIDEFAFLELSFNAQKLISPLSSSTKFRMIPNLWLGNQSRNGIELFAQNMASQIVAEAMGGDLISLVIKGQNQNPDKLIFVKTRVEAFFNEFDWTLFEEYLNGIYAHYLLRGVKERSNDNRSMNAFEALQVFDQALYTGASNVTDSELVMLDLNSLFEVIKKRKSTRFYFEKFYDDFINRLETQTRIDFHLVEISLKHWVFMVKANRFEDFYKDLRDFSQKFHYWKYFEDSEQFLTLDIKPKIKQIPMSSFALIQSLEEVELSAEERLLKERMAKQKTHELIWGRENIREI